MDGAAAPDRLAVLTLERLLAEPHVPQDLVRLRMGLLRAQQETLTRIPTGGMASRMPLTKDCLTIHPMLLEKMLTDLVAVLRDVGAGNPRLDRVIATPGIMAGFPEVARCAVFEPESAFLDVTASRLDLPVDVLRWLGRMLAAPFVTAAVCRMPDRARVAEATSSRCPFCDSSPALAILRRPDGRRLLVCGICGERWSSNRVECPFCTGTRKWMRLATDQDAVRWVETCDDCHGYIKTIDERQFPENEAVAPLAESVRTLCLDLSAEKLGYKPNLPYASLA